MAEQPSSRLAAARQRALRAKRLLAVSSTAAFGVALLWAHGSHPGTAPAVSGSGARSSTASLDRAAQSESFDFGEGAIAPSVDAAPDTSSHAS